MTCEDAHLHVHDYISGELSPEIRDELFDHLEACENCRATFHETNTMAARMDNLMKCKAPPELRSAVSGILSGA